jgi:sulfur carrier protein
VRITVNGRPRELDQPTTIGELVDGEVPARRGVAVAVDGEVLRRRDWDDTAIDDGMAIEIVGAVQGG